MFIANMVPKGFEAHTPSSAAIQNCVGFRAIDAGDVTFTDGKGNVSTIACVAGEKHIGTVTKITIAAGGVHIYLER
jgi:hypothetical protein